MGKWTSLASLHWALKTSFWRARVFPSVPKCRSIPHSPTATTSSLCWKIWFLSFWTSSSIGEQSSSTSQGWNQTAHLTRQFGKSFLASCAIRIPLSLYPVLAPALISPLPPWLIKSKRCAFQSENKRSWLRWVCASK